MEVETRKLWRACWVDPAGGPTATAHKKARAAIVSIGQDELERVFILDTWADRIAPDQLINKIFEINARFKPAVFGIDAGGPQLTFAQMVQREARDRGIRLPLRPQSSHVLKETFIENIIQPLEASGRLFRPALERCHSLNKEYNGFPDEFYKDQMDALAHAISILPATLPEHLKQMGREQMRRYLQMRGYSKEQIDNQLLSVHAQT